MVEANPEGGTPKFFTPSATLMEELVADALMCVDDDKHLQSEQDQGFIGYYFSCSICL